MVSRTKHAAHSITQVRSIAIKQIGEGFRKGGYTDSDVRLRRIAHKVLNEAIEDARKYQKTHPPQYTEPEEGIDSRTEMLYDPGMRKRILCAFFTGANIDEKYAMHLVEAYVLT